MVGIITGLGLGTQMSSLSQLGSSEGELGSSALGGFGENVFVNAANGNLVIEHTDQILSAVGFNDDLTSVYNSLAPSVGYNEYDNWQTNAGMRVVTSSLVGTLGESGSSIQVVGWSGSVYTYSWKSSDNYVCDAYGQSGNTLSYASNVWTLSEPASDVTYYFDATNSGRITEAKDNSGNTLTYTYPDSTHVKIASSDGEYLYLTYNTNGSLASLATYYYASSSAQESDTYTEYSNVTYGYDSYNRLSTVTTATSDGNSVTISYGYAANSGAEEYLISTISQTGGNELAIGYTEVGSGYLVSSLTQTVASGITNEATFAYNSGETTVTDNSGNVTKLYYDSSDDLTQVTLPAAQSGTAAQNLYYTYYGTAPNLDEVETAKDAAGNTTQYSWTSNDEIQQIIDRNGNTTNYTYDTGQHLTIKTTMNEAGSASDTMFYAYDAQERLVYTVTLGFNETSTGAAYSGGLITAYTNNSVGQLVSLRTYTGPSDSYPLGDLSATTPVTKSDAVGIVGGLTADLPTSDLTIYAYDYRGNLSTETQYSACNSSGNGLTSSPYTATTYKSDEFGNLYYKSVSDGGTTSYTTNYSYDGLNRLISETDPDGNTTATAYNDSGDTVIVTLNNGPSSSNGLQTVSTYNYAGQLISTVETGTGNDTGTATTTYQYDDTGSILNDLLGNLAAVTDPNGNTTYYLYDNVNRKVAEISATGTFTQYTYDADNQIVQTHTYNNPTPTASLSTIDTPNSNGQLTNPTVSSVRPYNNSADLYSWNVYDHDNDLVETIDGNGDATVYGYDGLGNQTSVTSYVDTVSTSGFSTTPPPTTVLPTADTYNPSSPGSDADQTTRYFYNVAGQVIGVLNADGYFTQNIYNDSGQKIQTIAYGHQVSTGDWASAAFNDVLTSAEGSGTTETTNYYYDGRGVLVYTLNAELVPTEYVYDDAGNLVETLQYAGPVSAAPTNNTVPAIQSAISGTSGLSTNAQNRTSWNVYDTTTGLLDFSIDAVGDVTEYTYNSTGQVDTTTQFATQDAVTSLPLLSTMTSWASSHSSSSNRITYDVYNYAGQLAYEINPVGTVTQYLYDQDGNTATETTFSTADSVGTLPTMSAMGTFASTYSAGTYAGTNEITQYVYDADGRLVYEADAASYTSSQYNYVVTQLDYNELGEESEKVVYASEYQAPSVGFTQAGMQGILPGSPPSSAETAKFTYDLGGRLTDTIDAASNDAHVVYDGIGRVVSSTAAYGGTSPATTSFKYDGVGQVLSTTDGAGATTSQTYDAFGNVVTSTNGNGYVTYDYYDLLNRLTLQLTPSYYGSGSVLESYATATSYYAFGDEIYQVEQYKTSVAGPFSPGTAPTPTGTYVTTTFTRDALGRVSEQEDGAGYTEEYTFDAFGDQKTVENQLGATTTYTYNNAGQVLTEVLPEDAYTSASTTTPEATSVENTYAYDAFGNMVKEKDAITLSEQTVTNYSYDLLNRMTLKNAPAITVTDPNESFATTTDVVPVTKYYYNTFGSLTEEVDPAGDETFYYYDSLDRKIAEVNGVGALTVLTYDDRNNVATETAYANEISLSGVTTSTSVATLQSDAGSSSSNRETYYGYDLDNRLTTTSVHSILYGSYNGTEYTTTTGNITSTNAYDADGNLIETTDGNLNNTYYYYNFSDQKVAEVDPDRYLTTYLLDYNGNVTMAAQYAVQIPSTETIGTGIVPTLPSGDQANAIVTTYTYDGDGNRLSKTQLDTLSYTVNSTTGALTTNTQTSATISWTYNGLGEVTSVTQPSVSPNPGDETTYTYDGTGQLTGTTQTAYNNQSGVNVQQEYTDEYNGLGELVNSTESDIGGSATMTPRTTSYTYGGGLLLSETDPTGFTQSYGYDVDGRLVSDTYSLAQPAVYEIFEMETPSPITDAKVYEYDAIGEQTEKTAATDGTSGWSFGDAYGTNYNAFGQVSSETINTVTQQTNTYNDAGQLVSSLGAQGNSLYIYDRDGNATLSITPTDDTLGGGYSWSSLTLSHALSLVESGDVVGGSDPTSDGLFLTYMTYDARDTQLSTVEPYAETTLATGGGFGPTTSITTSKTYDAFGNMLSETDGNGNTTDYSYYVENEAGTVYSYTFGDQIVSMTQPSVAYTKWVLNTETETLQYETESGNPVTTYYYDIGGRQVGTTDPNGNTTTESLLANTGYDGSKSLVLDTFNPDNSITKNFYDAFGELAKSEDGDGDVTTYDYDGDGRLLEQDNPITLYSATDPVPGNPTGNPVGDPPAGGNLQLIQYYEYDGLGERIASWNNEEETEIEGEEVFAGNSTTYDDEGRVVQSVEGGLNVTTYTYTWSSTLAPDGGWSEVTTNPVGQTQTEKTNTAGQIVSMTDFGRTGSYTLHYDAAGRLIQQVYPDSGDDGYTSVATNYTYYNTGLTASEDDTDVVDGIAYNQEATYAYDDNGNRTLETLSTFQVSDGTSSTPVSYEDATATYDAINRMLTYSDSGYEAEAPVSVTWSYDLDSNVIQQDASYHGLSTAATDDLSDATINGSATTQDYWFEYDSMNRVVVDDGIVGAGTTTLELGTSGTAYTYDAAGRRITSEVVIPTYYYGSDYTYQEQLETYMYTPSGGLGETYMATGASSSPSSSFVTPPSITPSEATATGTQQSMYQLDDEGNVWNVSEFAWSGTTESTVYSKAMQYGLDGLLSGDQITTIRGSTTYNEDDYYGYYSNGVNGDYLGAQPTSIYTITWVNGGEPSPESETVNNWSWVFGTQQLRSIDYYPDGPPDPEYTTTNTDNAWYQIQTATIDAASAYYTNTYVNNVQGDIISNFSTEGPASLYYMFDGKQIGGVTNNGTLNVSYAQSLEEQLAAPTSGYFANGALTGTSYAAFGTDSLQINSFGAGSASLPSYSVQAGDTLQSIAQAEYGDSSYWYLIADANGIQGDGQLTTGETLTMPVVSANSQNNASTDTVYNYNQALGNISPTHPPKPSAHHNCGVLGEIFLAVIALVVAYFVGPLVGSLIAEVTDAGDVAAVAATAASASVADVASEGISMAIGSAVSQGVGLATGLQNKFNWGAVAEAGLSAGVGAGIGGLGQLAGVGDLASDVGGFVNDTFGGGADIAEAVVSDSIMGAASSAITQGIEVATGLQKSFSWSSVAAAGLEQGVGGGVGAALNGVDFGLGSYNQYAGQLVSNTAGAIAYAATKTALGSGSFGENFAGAIPNAAAQAFAGALEQGIDSIGNPPDDGPVVDQADTVDGAPGGVMPPSRPGMFRVAYIDDSDGDVGNTQYIGGGDDDSSDDSLQLVTVTPEAQIDPEVVEVTGQELPWYERLYWAAYYGIGNAVSNVESDLTNTFAMIGQGQVDLANGSLAISRAANKPSITLSLSTLATDPGQGDWAAVYQASHPNANYTVQAQVSPVQLGGTVLGAVAPGAGLAFEGVGALPESVAVLDGSGGAISDITSLNAVTPTASSGYINSSLVSTNGLEIGVTGSGNQTLAQAIMNGQDASGALTEQLVDNVAESQGLDVLDGGSYGNNNGFDHVLQDNDGNVFVLDSKQFANGSTSLSNGAGGAQQLSNQWIDNVLNNLDEDSPAAQAVYDARANGSLYRGVIGVNRTTGNLVLMRVH